MKLRFSCILSLALLAAGCSPGKMVPEISKHLTTSPVTLSIQPITIPVYAGDGHHLYYLGSENRVVKYDSQNATIISFTQLTTALLNELTLKHDTLLLRTREKDALILLDPDTLRTAYQIQVSEEAELLAVWCDQAVLKHRQSIRFRRLQDGTILNRLKLKDESFLNAFRENQQLYLCTSRRILRTSCNQTTFQDIHLPESANSPLLIVKQKAFYGSAKSRLICFDLLTRKISWRIPLGMPLELKPLLFRDLIVIAPEDNSLYFYRPGGSLYWWYPVNTDRRFEPLTMVENVVVVLRDDTIQFFDPLRKKSTLYPLSERLRDKPVAGGNYLYGLTGGQDDKERRLVKVGNQYDVEIEQDPAGLIQPEQTVRFKLTTVNLIEPVINILIKDPEEASVLTTRIDSSDTPVFIWRPEKTGEYTLSIRVTSQNQKEITVVRSLAVHDLKAQTRRYILSIQNNCSILKNPQNEQ